MHSPHVPAMWTDTPFRQKTSVGGYRGLVTYENLPQVVWESLYSLYKSTKQGRKFYGWNKSGLKTRRESSPTLIFRWIGGLLTYPDLKYGKQRNDQTWGCEAESFLRWKEILKKRRWNKDHSWVHEFSWARFLVYNGFVGVKNPVASPIFATQVHNNSQGMLLVTTKSVVVLTARPWKIVVERLLPYWEGNFSGATLNFGRVLCLFHVLFSPSKINSSQFVILFFGQLSWTHQWWKDPTDLAPTNQLLFPATEVASPKDLFQFHCRYTWIPVDPPRKSHGKKTHIQPIFALVPSQQLQPWTMTTINGNQLKDQLHMHKIY